jgi:hypothetical protein
MARKGLFGRIFDRILHPFKGAPEPSEPEPEPSEPILPPKPPLGGGGERPPDDHEQRMQDIFENITGGLTGHNYLEWRELYDPMSVIFDDDSETEEYWEQFLRAYYLASSEAGSVSRDQFHRETGIPRSELDWELWRNLRRGTP